MAAIGFQQLVLAALLRPSELEIWQRRLRTDDETKCSLKDSLRIQLMKETSYILFLCQCIMWTVPFAMLMLHIPNISIHEGFSEEQGAFLMLLVGLGGTVGRILSSFSVGPNGVDPLLMNMGLEGILGLTSILFPLFSSSYLGEGIFACIFGFYNGSLIAMTIPVIIELFGTSNLNIALGISYFISGFGYMIGPVLAGKHIIRYKSMMFNF